MALITCRDLTLGYEGREILRDLQFELEQGDYLCIVGENGAGKSTLVRTILGLQPPMAGSIRFGDGLQRGQIGYLPQQTRAQRDFPASVREIVLSGFQGKMGLRPYYTRAEKERMRRNLARLGIEELEKRSYRELSGGQQQRVLLARALCAAERLLLLDEPAAGLDPVVTAELYRLIRSLNREDGLAVMMVSHDVGAIVREASHVLHLGKTGFFGTREEYLRSEPGRLLSGLEGGDGE